MKLINTKISIAFPISVLAIVVAWFLSAHFGISNPVLDPRHYVEWVENPVNGLRVNKQLGEFSLTAQYKPAKYIVVLEEKNERLSTAILEKRKSEIGDMQYFTFRIEKSNKQGDVLMEGIFSEEEYYARVGYLSLNMQNDFYLVEDNDTLSCRLFNFVRNYAIAPYVDFVLGFEKRKYKKGNSDKQFVYYDNTFGLGTVNFIIRQQDIYNIPNLKTY